MPANMPSKRQFDDLHLDTDHISMPGPSMYSDSASLASWSSSSYQYPSIMTSGPNGDYNNTWAYISTPEDDPSLLCSSSDTTNWSSYEPSAWTPSVNPSSASVYSTMTHPMSSTGFSSSNSTWGPSDLTSLSAYSEPNTYGERPSISRSVSADNTGANYMGYGTDYSPSTARMSSTAPASPGEYLASDIASTASQPNRPNTKTASKKSGRAGSDKSSSSSSKRKSAKSNNSTITNLNTERDYEAQLLARFGHMMAPVGNTPNITPSEQIRREAWRICKSEAMEMSQRRIKLLEHEHGALERETQKLQENIGSLRDAITEETLQLRVALAKAERLSAPY